MYRTSAAVDSRAWGGVECSVGRKWLAAFAVNECCVSASIRRGGGRGLAVAVVSRVQYLQCVLV